MNKFSENKLSEKKVLGILAIVFGGFGLLLSWVPIVNNFAFVLGVIALLLGLIGILVNRKNKKVLSVIGTMISIATIALVLFTQSVYLNAIDKASNSFYKQTSVVSNDSSSSKYKSESDKSSNQPVIKDNKLTKSDYDSIVIGYSLTGVGGTNFEDMKAKFGNPMNTITSDVAGKKMLIVSWYADGSAGANVTVTFYEQEDGSYLAASKSSFGM